MDVSVWDGRPVWPDFVHFATAAKFCVAAGVDLCGDWDRVVHSIF